MEKKLGLKKIDDEIEMFKNLLNIHRKYSQLVISSETEIELIDWIKKHDERQKDKLLKKIKYKFYSSIFHTKNYK